MRGDASEPTDEADRGRHSGLARHESFAGGPGSLSLSFGGGGGGWQMTRLNRRIGRGLLLLAFLLFMAIVIHPFALRGFVWGGKVEDGRYFVVSKGNRYTEVSEAQWRIAQHLECSFYLP